MKKILFSLVAIMFISSAQGKADTLKGTEDNSNLGSILHLVTSAMSTGSYTSNLTVNLLSKVGGDGMNPTRIVLSLNSTVQTSTGKEPGVFIYELDTMLKKVERVTFNAKDSIVINYIQETFVDAEDAQTVKDVKKSLIIKVLRNSKGDLINQIDIQEVSKK